MHICLTYLIECWYTHTDWEGLLISLWMNEPLSLTCHHFFFHFILFRLSNLFWCAQSLCHTTHTAVASLWNRDSYLWTSRAVSSYFLRLLMLILFCCVRSSCPTAIVFWWDQGNSWSWAYGLPSFISLEPCEIHLAMLLQIEMSYRIKDDPLDLGFSNSGNFTS